MVPQLVCDQDDLSLYQQLVAEIQAIGRDNLLVEWHGDTHLIANDKIGGSGRTKCQHLSILWIVCNNILIWTSNTRFNWYRDSKDWKPYHRRTLLKAHLHKHKIALLRLVWDKKGVRFSTCYDWTVVSCPQPNGCAYAFGRDVNLEWRHGVLPTKKETAPVEYLSLHGVTSNKQMRVQDRKITHF